MIPGPSSSTLLNLNIYETSRPIMIKFYLTHHCGAEKMHTVSGRLDQNSCSHGNQKLQWTYNGNIVVDSAFKFDRIFLKRSGYEDRHQISNKFGLLASELLALEHESHRLIMEKCYGPNNYFFLTGA